MDKRIKLFKRTRKAFLSALLGMMSLHLSVALGCGYIRNQAPVENLKLTSNKGNLVLFGYNKMGMNAYLMFSTWETLQKYLIKENLELPRIIEVSKNPPHRVEFVHKKDTQNINREHKILWSRNGSDNNVIYFPDLESAQIFNDYVNYNGLVESHLGFSLPIVRKSPRS